MDHLETGQLGEKLARKLLEKKGYKIVEQNYKTRYAEIDLIGIKKGVLVFVEVRTKRDEEFGAPEETINYFKRQKVLWNAQSYMAYKNWNGPCRIDAICIVLGDSDKPRRIDHYENIV